MSESSRVNVPSEIREPSATSVNVASYGVNTDVNVESHNDEPAKYTNVKDHKEVEEKHIAQSHYLLDRVEKAK